jgi:glycosyltransferase involved in cell wall biosynthesis
LSASAPRRILAVARNAVGGIRNYIKYTYGGLDPSRYRFTVVSIAGAESEHLQSDLSSIGARVIEVASSAELPDRVLREALSGEHDLLHSHGLRSAVYASPAVWVTRLMPFVRPLPHVVTSHDVFLPEEFSGAKGLLMRMGLTFVLNRAAAVHSVSEGAEKNLIEYLPGLRRNRRRYVVMNGIPPVPADEPAEGARWRSEMGGSGVKLFGFFGRFMPQKGFEYVIEAASLLQKDPRTRDRFKVVAVNAGSYIRERRADVERLGLADRFVFSGASAQPRALMERVDAVLMPSLWEACGLVAMETLWAGTPLISTAVHGLGDVTAGTPAIIVPPKDAPALAEAMRLIIERGEERRALAEAFRGKARERFDVVRASAGLETIFDRLLSPSEL